MIEIGEYNTLTILRETSVGLYLGTEGGEDVLLPNKYVPDNYEIDNEIDVFVYLDYDERKVATTLTPKILMKQFALLEVTAVSEYGAFLDWGLEKNLLLPLAEQRQRVEEGRWYIVYMNLDERTNRLYASNKIEKILDNTALSVEEGEEVNVVFYRETDIGYSVIVNHRHKGLVFKNELFKDIKIGDQQKAYVKLIRKENKLDISLQPIGYENFNSINTQKLYDELKSNEGFIPLTDKSAPDEIYKRFGISKKAFKKAVGDLYKQRKIEIEKKGIKLVLR